MEVDGVPVPERGLGPDPEGVAAVLVVVPGGMGSILKAVPALRHLRHLYEHARIDVAMEGAVLGLLDACPYIDECLDLHARGALLLRRYDVALTFASPGAQHEPLALKIDDVFADVRVAYRDAHEPSALPVHPVWPRRMTAAARMRYLAWLMGGEPRATGLAVWPRLADRNGAAELVPQARPLAVIHPCSGTEERRWHQPGFVRVLQLLTSLGLLPALIGVEADRRDNAALAAAAEVPVVDLTGLTDIGLLAGLIERAALFVGVDSGPAALAAALGTRSVVIGPSCAVEHSASPPSCSYVVHGSPDDTSNTFGPASGVELEDVLSAVSLAGHQAAATWHAERLD